MSRYRILKDRVEPKPRPVKKDPELVPMEKGMIRVREVGSVSFFDWAVESDIIKNLKIVERMIAIKKSKQYPEGYELVRAEYDIINPRGDWEQAHLRKKWYKGDEGYEKTGSYDNEFEIIFPEKLNNLQNLNVEALKDHLHKYYEKEFHAALDMTASEATERCPNCGGEFGTDGNHSNEYCKKCFEDVYDDND